MNKRTALILLFVLSLALAPAAFSPLARRAQAQGQLAFGAQRFPAIVIDQNDNLYLAMSTATAPASERRPHSQIFFTVSHDYGITWDNIPTMRNLSKSPGEAFGPSIAVNRQGKLQLYITYHDNSGGTNQAHLLRTKKKTKFRGAANITPHDGAAIAPRVAVDSKGAVFVVWGDGKEGSRVALVRSTDAGASFGDPVYISRSSTAAFEPEIAVDSGDAINVVWQDSSAGSIMFARSTDGGDTFSEPQQLSKGEGQATEAHIAADAADRLSVVWVQAVGDSFQAFYSRSTDGGGTFSDPVNVSNFTNGNIHKPVLATYRDSTVYVAFQNGDLFNEDTGSKRQVYLIKSTDAGVSFSDPVQVSNADNSKGRAHSPAMVADSRGMLHIVWIDASVLGKDEGLLFYSNTDNGRRFSRQQPIISYMFI